MAISIRKNEREIIHEVINNIIDYAYREYKSDIFLEGWDKKGAIVRHQIDEHDRTFFHIGYFGKPRGFHLLKVKAMQNKLDDDPKSDEIIISANSSAVFGIMYN